SNLKVALLWGGPRDKTLAGPPPQAEALFAYLASSRTQHYSYTHAEGRAPASCQFVRHSPHEEFRNIVKRNLLTGFFAFYKKALHMYRTGQLPTVPLQRILL